MRAVGDQTDTDAATLTEGNDPSLTDQLDSAVEEYALGEDDVFDEPDYSEDDYDAAPDRRHWIPPALAGFAVILWTGFYGWALQSTFANIAGIAPAQWVRLIIDWAVPVVLIGMVWMIAVRAAPPSR